MNYNLSLKNSQTYIYKEVVAKNLAIPTNNKLIIKKKIGMIY